MAASSGTTVHEGLAIVTGAGWLTFFQVCRWGLRLLCANQGLHSRQTLSRKVGIVVYIACQDLGKQSTAVYHTFKALKSTACLLAAAVAIGFLSLLRGSSVS